MNLQRSLKAMTLVVVAVAMSAGAAIITNNKTDWNGVTNTTTGGRWSYFAASGTPSNISGVALLGGQYGTAQDNWCVDSGNTNRVWYVQNSGVVVTDTRDMAWNYTSAVGSSDVTISGSYGYSSNWEFAIYKTTDTNQGVVDLSTKQLLYHSNSNAGNFSTFNLTTSLAPGNDLLFVSNTVADWQAPNALDATITIVPEPAALSLLALGGLVLFRRRR